jgi:protease IV
MFGRTKQRDDDTTVVDKFVFEIIREQRRARRWGIFFKLLGFGYLFLLLVLMLNYDIPGLKEATDSSEGHTAVVRIEDVIASTSDASADKIIRGLRAAFEDKNTKGVVMRINTPGGSPVQSGYINDEIMRLREKYPDTPIYAVVTDMCASGGYYIAAAAEKIYADKASIVGSIGVLINSFGFTGAMDKLGVERRLYTAGEHKGMLDPFSPAQPDDVAHAQVLLDNMHQQFIDTVKKGRGERLVNDPRLFSGMFWTGEQAKELGLVDELGSTALVAREVFKAEKTKDFTPKKDYLERFAERFGAATARMFWRELESRQTAVPLSY